MEATEEDAKFEQLLAYLKQNRGFDFHGYKRTSLTRRVRHRMATVGIADFGDYQDYLEVHPEEFPRLFNTILINVTTFFRDPETWEFLANDIVPRLLAEKDTEEAIRVWSAGCASGEEAYTLAMMLAEAIGSERLVRGVKIYATDMDDEALAYARHASYTAKEVAGVPAPLLEKYFETQGSRYVFRKELRRVVIFGRHDLIVDAPISRIDLLTCRNTVMYFNAETQARILARLRFALAENGFLLLGKAEMILSHGSLFTPVDIKQRVFRRAIDGVRERLPLAVVESARPPEAFALGRLREAAEDAAPLAQIVVDSFGIVAVVNERARTLFGIASREVGRPLRDLEISYKPVELRSCVERVASERRAMTVRDVAFPEQHGEARFFDVQLTPLVHVSHLLGVLVSFLDISQFRALQQELRYSNQELETAYEELQSTTEELETTNEELQSTVEELETTNEELQSTNEELETMNAELQSTNEAQFETNEHMRTQDEGKSDANAFLSTVLSALPVGVVVLDPGLRVTMWNARAAEQWGIRPDEAAGRELASLDIGLPVEALQAALQAAADDGVTPTETRVDAVNRRGKKVRCAVTIAKLSGRGVMVMIDDRFAAPS